MTTQQYNEYVGACESEGEIPQTLDQVNGIGLMSEDELRELDSAS